MFAWRESLKSLEVPIHWRKDSLTFGPTLARFSPPAAGSGIPQVMAAIDVDPVHAGQFSGVPIMGMTGSRP